MTFTGRFLTIGLCIVALVLPRRFASLAYAGAVLYITQGQYIEIAGINFTSIRFVEIAVTIRLVVRNELAIVSLNVQDCWFSLFFICYPLVYLLRSQSLDGYTIGLSLDAFLVYFSFRALLQNPDDFYYFMKGMVILLVPFSLFLIVEGMTGYNLFSRLGGIEATPVLRDGFYRCQGSFRHAITAGTVGATFLPIFIGFLFHRSCRWCFGMGVTASIIIVLASHSSGPLMTTIAGFAAWSFWLCRRSMKWVRRCLVTSIVGLHLVMNAPVWFIFARLSDYIGGDGWHRSNLINKFVINFDAWWLVGMPLEETQDWAATMLRQGSVDVTNYYVWVGINGGLISLVFLIMFLTSTFRMVGSNLKVLRNNNSKYNLSLEPVLWGVGVAVFCHAVNQTSVVYFDQSYVMWYLHLAMAVSLSQSVHKRGHRSFTGMTQWSSKM